VNTESIKGGSAADQLPCYVRIRRLSQTFKHDRATPPCAKAGQEEQNRINDTPGNIASDRFPLTWCGRFPRSAPVAREAQVAISTIITPNKNSEIRSTGSKMRFELFLGS
jgi:hypothetical protein